jgi:hypothetical protein
VQSAHVNPPNRTLGFVITAMCVTIHTSGHSVNHHGQNDRETGRLGLMRHA